MEERRIGDEQGAPQRTHLKPTAGFTRFGAALASPLGVVVTVPLLVGSVALFSTIIGQAALRETSIGMAEERFRGRAILVGQHVEDALRHADAVLDRTSDYARAGGDGYDFEPMAITLRDLCAGRPGMSQIFVGLPSGEYFGVYEEENRFFFQHSVVTGARSQIEHFTYEGSSLRPLRREDSDYDPRKRVWYQLAREAKTRVWTDTYPFFTTGHTGVTRAQPLYEAGPDSTLVAVAGVDFDVSALSANLSRAESASTHLLIYAADGSLLAYPLLAQRLDEVRPQDHALGYRDLRDPFLDAYFAGLPEKVEPGALRAFDFQGRRMLTSAVPMGLVGLPWTVAIFAPEDVVLSPLVKHQRRALSLGFAALVAALVVAWLFARHVVRQRRQVAQARKEAAIAERRATELGSYRLVSLLGKGGMGEVWRARHQLLAREAAIKLISPELHEGRPSDEIVERFRREAQTIAALRSRNTVSLFDYGVTRDGTFFYVMEMLDGIDLETLVERHGPQPPGRVINILIQACNSLGEAHEAGLVHRDVKPANLFLCRAADEVDVVKVLDFGLVMAGNEEHSLSGPASGQVPVSGAEEPSESSSSTTDSLAKKVGRLTRAGDYLGTPAFIAPEQALGHSVDGRADLYALGCIGVWLLTGQLLFDEPTALAMMLAHIRKPCPALGTRVSAPLPPGLELVLTECLAKDPEERPPSARALALRLRSLELEPEQRFGDIEAHEWWSRYIPNAADVAVSTMPTVDSGSHLTALRIADERQVG